MVDCFKHSSLTQNTKMNINTKIESTSPYNDGWTQQAYKDQLLENQQAGNLIKNKNKNMKVKSKYLLNIEGKKRYRANSWLGLILNIIKGNHDRKAASTN